MTSKALLNLAKTGSLKVEAADKAESDGLVKSARAKMADVKLVGLSRAANLTSPMPQRSFLTCCASLAWLSFG